MLSISSPEDFEQTIHGNHLTCVEFSTEWCVPCKRIAPALEKLAGATPRVCFAKVDVDALPDIQTRLSLGSLIPAFAFFVDGILQPGLTVVGANVQAVKAAVSGLQ